MMWIMTVTGAIPVAGMELTADNNKFYGSGGDDGIYGIHPLIFNAKISPAEFTSTASELCHIL